MNIRARAFELAEAVVGFADRARRFFYDVVLSGLMCPSCGGVLTMIREGLCRCHNCDKESDPTPTFQRCPECGGKPVLRVRRYQCESCGSDVPSRFLFDGLVFDTEYFRERMAESRQRKQEQLERVRQMLADSRSSAVPLPPCDLDSVPGLVDVLNSLTAGIAPDMAISGKSEFDLKRYQSHIEAHIGDVPRDFDDIPALHENNRLDRIWRFIAILFLAQDRVIDIWQDGGDIMVIRHDVDAEGYGIPGEVEAAA